MNSGSVEVIVHAGKRIKSGTLKSAFAPTTTRKLRELREFYSFILLAQKHNFCCTYTVIDYIVTDPIGKAKLIMTFPKHNSLFGTGSEMTY